MGQQMKSQDLWVRDNRTNLDVYTYGCKRIQVLSLIYLISAPEDEPKYICPIDEQLRSPLNLFCTNFSIGSVYIDILLYLGFT